MPQSAVHNRARACLLAASLIFAATAFAGVVQPSPSVPPEFGFYAIPDTCVSVVCLENIMFGNFTGTTASIVGSDELTTSNAELTAAVFQNVGGNPGLFISPLLLSGPVSITYFGKTALDEVGTFNDQITSLDLTGTFNGHTAEIILNPAQNTTGQTTITHLGGEPPAFRIDSFFDVFTELSIDGGTFIPGPERTADLTTPEPASAAFAMVGLLTAAVCRLRRRQKASQ